MYRWGHSHTWPSCLVPCLSTTVSPPLSLAGLCSHCIIWSMHEHVFVMTRWLFCVEGNIGRKVLSPGTIEFIINVLILWGDTNLSNLLVCNTVIYFLFIHAAHIRWWILCVASSSSWTHTSAQNPGKHCTSATDWSGPLLPNLYTSFYFTVLQFAVLWETAFLIHSF